MKIVLTRVVCKVILRATRFFCAYGDSCFTVFRDIRFADICASRDIKSLFKFSFLAVLEMTDFSFEGGIMAALPPLSPLSLCDDCHFEQREKSKN